MTTKQAGGKITGLLALTMEAQVEVRQGDFVHVVGDYEVEIADGTKPVLGHVSVSNIRGSTSDEWGSTYGLPIIPGDVTVEARGFYVKTIPASAAVAAGVDVGIEVGGDLATAGAGVATIGISLTAAAAAGDPVDVLVR